MRATLRRSLLRAAPAKRWEAAPCTRAYLLGTRRQDVTEPSAPVARAGPRTAPSSHALAACSRSARCFLWHVQRLCRGKRMHGPRSRPRKRFLKPARLRRALRYRDAQTGCADRVLNLQSGPHVMHHVLGMCSVFGAGASATACRSRSTGSRRCIGSVN